MAADIVWSDIVGAMSVEDGGIAGDLLTLTRAHIEDAVNRNGITREQAGAVYTAMIPSAIENAIQFALQEKLIEAQIDKAVSEALIAATEAVNSKARTLAEIIKVYGFDATLDVDGNIDIGANNNDGKLDHDKELVREQTESEAKQNEVDGVIDKQVLDIIKTTDVRERTTAIQEAESIKNVLLKQEQIESEALRNAEVTGTIIKEGALLDKQILKVEAETDVVEQKIIGRKQISTITAE